MSDMWRWAKEKVRSTSYALSGRTENEKLVLEATNDEKWGPTNSQMQEIARITMNYSGCDEVKRVIWERLSETEVRHVQKALLLLEYLLRNGHTSFRSEARSMSGLLQSLTYMSRYTVGEEAALQEVVKRKAKDILAMVNDEELYNMEREKAQKIKSKVTSYGNDGGFGGSYGGYDNYSNYSSAPARSGAAKGGSDDEYEYEYSDDDARAQSPKAAADTFDPFGTADSAPAPAPAPAPKQRSSGAPLPPPPGAKPRLTKAPMVKQQPFDPFGNGADPFSQMESGSSAAAPKSDPLLDLFAAPAPAPAPASNNFDDLLGLAPVSSANANTNANTNAGSNVDLLGDFISVAPAPQPQKPPQKSNMFAEFSDLVDLDNLGGNQKTYGKAQTQRGSGRTLGNF